MGSFSTIANMMMPVVDYIIKDVNEDRIESLSKVMGLRYSSKIFMQITIAFVFLAVFIIPVNLIVVFTLVPNFDISLMIVCSILYYLPIVLF